MIEHFVCGNR